MDTVRLRELVRRRHPALTKNGSLTTPGAWTVIEECLGCDLYAFSALPSPPSAHPGGDILYPRVGYELKVSRSDMRHELLKPSKRYMAKLNVHAFYIAAPKGMLTKEEIVFDEPEGGFTGSDFVRPDCPHCLSVYGSQAKDCLQPEVRKQYKLRSTAILVANREYNEKDLAVNPDNWEYLPDRNQERAYALCRACKGTRDAGPSVVEKTAPTLWIPPDIGFVEASESGCRVIKPAPINPSPKALEGEALGIMIRHISSHPDPRHEDVIEQARNLSREYNKLARQDKARRDKEYQEAMERLAQYSD